MTQLRPQLWLPRKYNCKPFWQHPWVRSSRNLHSQFYSFCLDSEFPLRCIPRATSSIWACQCPRFAVHYFSPIHFSLVILSDFCSSLVMHSLTITGMNLDTRLFGFLLCFLYLWIKNSLPIWPFFSLELLYQLCSHFFSPSSWSVYRMNSWLINQSSHIATCTQKMLEV